MHCPRFWSCRLSAVTLDYVEGSGVGTYEALEVEGISKAYDETQALDNVSLTIAPGEVLGLLGANGAGKTTLISIVTGLLVPDEGSVRVAGIDVQRAATAARRLMGAAPQNLSIYLQLSVRKNLLFFGRLLGLRRGLHTRIEELVTAFDLEDVIDRRTQELSGGQQRRVHTAIAMMRQVPLLLLDEPTAGVDVHTRARLLALIKEHASQGVAICYTTHYLPEIESLDASVAILEQGSLIARGRVDELIATSSTTVVEVRFDRAVPAGLSALGTVDETEAILRIHEQNSSEALTRALTSLADVAEQVRSVELVQPSLESVYLSMTGRRFASEAKEVVA